MNSQTLNIRMIIANCHHLKVQLQYVASYSNPFLCCFYCLRPSSIDFISLRFRPRNCRNISQCLAQLPAACKQGFSWLKIGLWWWTTRADHYVPESVKGLFYIFNAHQLPVHFEKGNATHLSIFLTSRHVVITKQNKPSRSETQQLK